MPLKLIEKEQAKKRSNSAAKNEQQLQVFDDAETDQVAEDDDDDDEDEEIFDLGMGSDVDDDEDKDGDEDDDEVRQLMPQKRTWILPLWALAGGQRR